MAGEARRQDHHLDRRVIEAPDLVRWEILHLDCDPRRDVDAYVIDVERARTPGEVIDWAAHLLEKRWLVHTNWADVLRAVALQLESARPAA
jgi:hypothetical protein